MERSELKKQYQKELVSILGQIETAKDTLRDSLLNIGAHSTKDTTALIIRLEDEARHVRICLEVLER